MGAPGPTGPPGPPGPPGPTGVLDLGHGNTAEGSRALASLTTGSNNTANGTNALFNVTTAGSNTATGFGALQNNKATANTANGANALFSNTIGIQNTATGFNALLNNTAGGHNTANGFSALQSNTTGNNNTANGQGALNLLTTGSFNTADGQGALKSLTTGSNNVALGFSAGQTLTTGSNNIDIGAAGVSDESGKIRIGTKGTHNGTFIAGISGVAVTGSTVVVNSNGKLGIATSSARFKEAIKPIGTASEAILALKPVTFRYKEEVDPDKIPQFGLVAEEVEKVDPKLVIHDEQGKPFTVHYEAVNAMLLNEFLKEHRKVQQLEANALEQQKQIEALTTAVQRMSIQLERDKTNLSVSGPSLAGHPSDPTLEPRLMKGQ